MTRDTSDGDREGSSVGNGSSDDGHGAATDPLAHADVRRVLGPDGRVLPDATVPDLSDEALVAIHRDMVITRRFDERAVSIQRQGRMGTPVQARRPRRSARRTRSPTGT